MIKKFHLMNNFPWFRQKRKIVSPQAIVAFWNHNTETSLFFRNRKLTSPFTFHLQYEMKCQTNLALSPKMRVSNKTVHSVRQQIETFQLLLKEKLCCWLKNKCLLKTRLFLNFLSSITRFSFRNWTQNVHLFKLGIWIETTPMSNFSFRQQPQSFNFYRKVHQFFHIPFISSTYHKSKISKTWGHKHPRRWTLCSPLKQCSRKYQTFSTVHKTQNNLIEFIRIFERFNREDAFFKKSQILIRALDNPH